MNNVNINITDSPLFPLCAKQLFMSKGKKYCYIQLDNEYFRHNLQKHISEGLEILENTLDASQGFPDYFYDEMHEDLNEILQKSHTRGFTEC